MDNFQRSVRRSQREQERGRKAMKDYLEEEEEARLRLVVAQLNAERLEAEADEIKAERAAREARRRKKHAEKEAARMALAKEQEERRKKREEEERKKKDEEERLVAEEEKMKKAAAHMAVEKERLVAEEERKKAAAEKNAVEKERLVAEEERKKAAAERNVVEKERQVAEEEARKKKEGLVVAAEEEKKKAAAERNVVEKERLVAEEEKKKKKEAARLAAEERRIRREEKRIQMEEEAKKIEIKVVRLPDREKKPSRDDLIKEMRQRQELFAKEKAREVENEIKYLAERLGPKPQAVGEAQSHDPQQPGCSAAGGGENGCNCQEAQRMRHFEAMWLKQSMDATIREDAANMEKKIAAVVVNSIQALQLMSKKTDGDGTPPTRGVDAQTQFQGGRKTDSANDSAGSSQP